ncbi:GTPase IMAP family member 9-like [Hemibagrus wyckioides]|uniref:GTPase IMAP family member 9-like n=1 Tax=Hemibagrus wyckioides TaxID=337641 RepID=UPI00266C8230|nr:GTPase IMAP family member 9-like [Hemibagrus wyckioides]
MAAAEGAPAVQWPAKRTRRRSLLEPPTMSTSLRIIIFGSSGHQQFSLTESILQRAVFTGADPHTILTTKTSGEIPEKKVTLVNTPNLVNHDLFHYTLKKELKKAVCFSCPGPHAVLFTLNPSEIPSNVYDIYKPLVRYFGDQILKYTMIVLYHEEEELSESEDSMKENKQFKKLLEDCGQRYLVFSGMKNRSEGEMTRQLFEEIEKMVAEHGIFSNSEFEDADKRIRKEEKILQDHRKKEVSAMLEELKKKHSQEDLGRETERYEEKIRLENREKAEMQIAERLGFTLRLVDYAAAVGKGAFAGAVLAGAMGFPGMAVGAVVGAALGCLLGGAATAAWNIVSNALADFGRHAA